MGDLRAAPRTTANRRALFYTVSGVKLVDEAAAIELLNKFCVNETFGFKIGHRGIAHFHQTLHVVETFHGGIRFSVRGTEQILVALLGCAFDGKCQSFGSLCWGKSGSSFPLFSQRALQRSISELEPCRRRGAGTDQLRADELCVEPVLGKKESVETLFGDATLVENNDMVGVANRRETVSDHQSGAPLGEMGERLMDQLFIDGVEMRCGLVKDEDGSIFEQRPGNGESLPLSAGKLNATLADHGIVGKRQLGDELVRVSALRGFLDGFIGGLRLGQAQVLPNGGVKKVGLLRDQSNFRSQVIESERTQVVSLQ